MRDEPAGVELGEDAVEPQLVLERVQLLGHLLGRADDDLAADRILVGQRVEHRGALGPAFAGRCAGAVRRGPEARRLLAKEMHDARLGLGARPLYGLADIERDPQIYPSVPL